MPATNNKKFGELGYSGTSFYSGQIDEIEWVSELQGLLFFETVERQRTDSIIKAIEKGFFLPIKNSRVSFSYDIDIQENLEYQNQLAFIEKQFSNISMNTFLGNACLSIPNGVMLFELVYQLEKWHGISKYIGLKKIAPRHPKTLNQWLIDKNGLVEGFKQDVQTENKDFDTVDIQGLKFFYITHDYESGNIEGTGEYRSIYREWKIKNEAWKQIAFTMQRMGAGVPIAFMETDSTSNIDDVENVLKGLRANQSAYAVFKGVKDVKWWAPEKSAIDGMLAVIKQCNEDIAKAAIQAWLNLGTSSSGSRSLGDTFSDQYFNSLEGLAKEISDSVNEQVIKRLIIMNFGQQENYPKMHLGIAKDIKPILEVYTKLKIAGLITSNKNFENWVNEKFNMPLTNDENKLETIAQPMINQKQFSEVPIIGESDNFNGFLDKLNKCNCEPKPIKLNDSYNIVEKKDFQLSEVKFNDNYIGEKEQAILNLAEMKDNLNALKKDMIRELRAVVQPEMIKAANELGSGKKIFQVKIEFKNKVADIFRKFQKRLLKIADNDVKNELIKQNVKLSEFLFAIDKDKSKKQLKTNKDGATPEEINKGLLKNFEDQPDIQSEFLRNRTQNDMIKYYNGAVGSGLSGKELSKSIIDQVIEEVGQRYETETNKLLGGYALAREISAEEYEKFIEKKTRTEMMESADICGNCQGLHGLEYRFENGEWINDEGYPYFPLPDIQNCLGTLGGNDCRGIWIYETGGL